MTTIRKAQIEDTDAIVALGLRWLAESPVSDLTASNPPYAKATAEMLISAPYARTFVADKDGEIIGILGIVVMPQLFSGEIAAQEVIWYVPPEHRLGAPGLKLLWAAQGEARSMGAKLIKMSAPTPDTVAFYRGNQDYRDICTVFVRKL